jgi:beta-lactam-binding protein with PASTA domain
VLAQDPPAHAQDIAQPTVNLLIAAPDADTLDAYLMPDMTGWRAIGAQAELTKAGIKSAPLNFVDVNVPEVGADGTPPKAPIVPGTIIAQSPAAGTRIDKDTTVTLTVAR